MRKYRCLFYSFFLLTSFSFGQSFKTVGYLPYYRFALVDQIDFSKLTHLNIAFANPDSSGRLSTGGSDIEPVLLKAQQQGVNVYISLAGAALTEDQESAWLKLLLPENRGNFIAQILDYVKAHQLDGIDIDLEWGHVNEDYSGFILALRDSIDRYGLGLTAALPGQYRYPEITDEALKAFDWINMMVYDLTGPWSPQNPGPHSTFAHALEAIDNWTNQGVEKSRLTLGVPFYGYDFSDLNNIVARSYGEMVAINSDYANLDRVGEMYYNGLITIEQKTQLALQQLAGVMIWEIGQDDFGAYSLLDRIWQTIHQTVATQSTEITKIGVFPNPFGDYLEVDLGSEVRKTLSIYNLQGEPVFQDVDYSRINTEELSPGFYYLVISVPGFRQVEKLLKIR